MKEGYIKVPYSISTESIQVIGSSELPNNIIGYQHVNKVIPFKNRNLDKTKIISLYRNLNCSKGSNKKYSILQEGLVVGHTNLFFLKDAVFKVYESGRQRVLKEKKKNVHSFCTGYISEVNTLMPFYNLNDYSNITYNPYENESFQCEAENIHGAELVMFCDEGVFKIK